MQLIAKMQLNTCHPTPSQKGNLGTIHKKKHGLFVLSCLAKSMFNYCNYMYCNITTIKRFVKDIARGEKSTIMFVFVSVCLITWFCEGVCSMTEGSKQSTLGL